MKCTYFFPLLCCFFIIFEANAQKYDTAYIQDVGHKYMFRINFQQAMNRVVIQDKVFQKYTKTNRDTSRLNFEPNLSFNAGLGFAYKWIGFDIRVSKRFEDSKMYGTSQSLDFQVNKYFRHVVADLYYVWYKGYYLQNPKYLFPNRQAHEPFPQYPQMQTESWGFSAMYIFNARKFSYQSIFTQAEVQRKSVGTWLLGLYYHNVRLHNDEALIPENMQLYFDKTSLFTRYRNQDFGIKGGFCKKFCFRKKQSLDS